MREWKALFCSDLHMSNALPMARPVGAKGLTDRFVCQLNMLEGIGRSAVKHRAKAVIILGDLFDKSRVDAVTLTETTKVLRTISREVALYIMAGNHDAVSVHGERFTPEVFGAMEDDRIHYVDGAAPLAFRGAPWLRFWPVPYGSLEATRTRLAAIRKRRRDKRRCEVALLHQSILGCDHESNKCKIGLAPGEVCKGFSQVISGHFHTPQKFGQCGMYCGAPLHFRFDDAKRKAGWWILTFREDGSLKRRFVRSNTPRFHTLEWPEKLGEAKAGDYVRIVVSATHADYEQLKGSVRRYADTLESRQGVTCKIAFDPVYHHGQRLQGEEGRAVVAGTNGKVSLAEIVEQYVEDSSVDTQGLDRKRLKELGREFLAAAEMQGREE